jgi:CDP-glycerol glycerophosphotransferase
MNGTKQGVRQQLDTARRRQSDGRSTPEVSIIVPVYDVEAYLGECLDSILSQDFTDFELVAVNDCSNDGSAAILRRYGAAERRIRIVELSENVGLGRARNAGLDHAKGKYVWFIDSDDTIVPGALRALVDRAHDTEAELVLCGWTRDFERQRRAGTGEAVLAAAPRLFTVAEYPKALRILQVAWNKLIRRDLLDRTGLRFVSGWYEDTPFTYPLLAGARSITALPDALVRYRQRPGAITKTWSERQMDVLTQWERAMGLVGDMHKDAGAIKAELYPVMLNHCARILLNSKRIPRSLQQEYVRRLQDLYRRHYPDRPYPRLGRQQGVLHRLIALGSLPLLKLHWRALSIWRRHLRARSREADRPRHRLFGLSSAAPRNPAGATRS